MITFYARGKFTGLKIGSKDQIKERIRQERHPELDRKEVFEYYQLDHIIPYSISQDSSMSNLQILTRSDHNKKTGKDRIIINKLKEKGLIERGVGRTIHLVAPIETLKEEYIKIFKELN